VLLLCLSILFQVQASPYVVLADDFLASACSFALVAVFVLSYEFKSYELVGLPEIESKMSIEQSDYYIINQSRLAFVMVACILGTLLLSLALFAVQVVAEGRRLRREVRARMARRLRYLADDREVMVRRLPADYEFHLFLSHVWGTGQDQMRIVKARLRELIPELAIFLDVDDLEEIGNLAQYIQASLMVLVYCSQGYFTSKNCMRELVAAFHANTPLIALVDLDQNHYGGLSIEEVCAQLQATDSMATRWGFRCDKDSRASHAEWHKDLIWPGGRLLYDRLLGGSEPIEWNRIGHFQDVTLRLIAERCLDPGGGAAGTTYVDGEILNQKRMPLRPPERRFHVFCSPHNLGALDVMIEVSRKYCLAMEHDMAKVATAMSETTAPAPAPASAPAPVPINAINSASSHLQVTTDFDRVSECNHMLLYLNGKTWTRPFESAQLAQELMWAIDSDVHVLLVHEMQGLSQEHRFGCDFSSFFSDAAGSTPPELLHRNIYSEIAIPLRGGPWREPSMALLAMALTTGKAEIELAADSGGTGVALKAALSALVRPGSAMFLRAKSNSVTKKLSTGTSLTRAPAPQYSLPIDGALGVGTQSCSSLDDSIGQLQDRHISPGRSEEQQTEEGQMRAARGSDAQGHEPAIGDRAHIEGTDSSHPLHTVEVELTISHTCRAMRVAP